MTQIATHDGEVVEVHQQKVVVQMHVVSACASCKAHDKCAFVDKADKIVEVETDQWTQYNVGDSVEVSVNEGLGLFAVLLAYIIPAVVLILTVVFSSMAFQSEVLAALVTLLVVTVYYMILFKFRNRLQRKFSFGLRPIES